MKPINYIKNHAALLAAVIGTIICLFLFFVLPITVHAEDAEATEAENTEEDDDVAYKGYYEDDFANDNILDVTSDNDYQKKLVDAIAKIAQALFMEGNTGDTDTQHMILPSLVAAEAMYVSQYGNSELAAKYYNYYNIPFTDRTALGLSSTDYTDIDAWSIADDGTWYQETNRWCAFSSTEKGIRAWYTWLEYKGIFNTAAYTKTADNISANSIMSYTGVRAHIYEIQDYTDGEHESELNSIVDTYSLWDYDIEVFLTKKAYNKADAYESAAEDSASEAEDMCGNEYDFTSYTVYGQMTFAMYAYINATGTESIEEAEDFANEAKNYAAQAQSYVNTISVFANNAVDARDYLEDLVNSSWLDKDKDSDYNAYDTENTHEYVHQAYLSACESATAAQTALEDAQGYASQAMLYANIAAMYVTDLKTIEKAEGYVNTLRTYSTNSHGDYQIAFTTGNTGISLSDSIVEILETVESQLKNNYWNSAYNNLFDEDGNEVLETKKESACIARSSVATYLNGINDMKVAGYEILTLLNDLTIIPEGQDYEGIFSSLRTKLSELQTTGEGCYDNISGDYDSTWTIYKDVDTACGDMEDYYTEEITMGELTGERHTVLCEIALERYNTYTGVH